MRYVPRGKYTRVPLTDEDMQPSPQLLPSAIAAILDISKYFLSICKHALTIDGVSVISQAITLCSIVGDISKDLKSHYISHVPIQMNMNVHTGKEELEPIGAKPFCFMLASQ